MSAHARGVLCAVASTLLIVCADAVSKRVVGDGAVPLAQFMTLRAVLALPLVALIGLATGGRRALAPRRAGLSLLRAAIALAVTVLVILSLTALPFATCLALIFTAPLMIVALSHPLLGERPGARRWAAVAIGFAGALVALRPRLADHGAAALLPLATALGVALQDIVTRRATATETAPSLLLVTMTVTAAGGAIWMSRTGWTAMADAAVWTTVGGSVVLTLAFLANIVALSLVGASTVAPLRYLSLVWAIPVGFVVWGEVPDLAALAGGALIIGGGLLAARRA
jgi:drug/metabolite transporter (DMT)-like permease